MKNILLALLFVFQFSWGQAPINFDKEDYYFLQKSENLKIELIKGELKIENNVLEKAKYNSGNMIYFANENIHFDNFIEISDINAYTETTSDIIKVDHFETKDQFGGSVFFSDQQSINFIFPAVGKDAITSLSYKEIIKDPHFLGTFRFGTYVPTKEATYSIEVPKGVELGFKTFNLNSIGVSFEEIKNKKTTTYKWKASNIPQYRKTENSLSILNYLPHIIVYIKSYKSKGKKKKVLNDAADLYNWYSSLTSQIKNSDLSEVYKLSQELVKGVSTEKEKAKKIFNWVQNNINYIAFEDGLGGFIPRDAGGVFTKKYGDCKDMANLLHVMLNYVGIKAYHTWIGTRERPYSYSEVPTPIVDNHMITTIKIDNDFIFLDATDSYVPFGMPSSFIQGKEALIGLNENKFEIVKVPVQQKENNNTLVETTVFLQGDIIKATSKRKLDGYEKVDFIYDVKYKKDEKSDEEYLNDKFEIGNNKTTYSNINLGELTNTSQAISIDYDVEIHNYIKTIGSKIFINLNLEKPLGKDIIDLEHEHFGKEIAHKFKRDYITTFQIPSGYKLKSVPDNISNELEPYGFSFKYLQKNDQLIVHLNVYMNILEIANEDFDDYNLFIKKLLKVYRKNITLEKID